MAETETMPELLPHDIEHVRVTEAFDLDLRDPYQAGHDAYRYAQSGGFIFVGEDEDVRVRCDLGRHGIAAQDVDADVV
jgi:hypothetical protein